MSVERFKPALTVLVLPLSAACSLSIQIQQWCVILLQFIQLDPPTNLIELLVCLLDIAQRIGYWFFRIPIEGWNYTRRGGKDVIFSLGYCWFEYSAVVQQQADGIFFLPGYSYNYFNYFNYAFVCRWQKCIIELRETYNVAATISKISWWALHSLWSPIVKPILDPLTYD